MHNFAVRQQVELFPPSNYPPIDRRTMSVIATAAAAATTTTTLRSPSPSCNTSSTQANPLRGAGLHALAHLLPLILSPNLLHTHPFHPPLPSV
ncbi:unnamed protein product [Hydatigera taeniaeformis]|uniref:Uncharacterized protein n=1 Tax=Hydatigena taeniaeformis TaxID=6205 RepID=A0A3P7ERI3_HYDTA|nr:unnamed protein product [Hydatigera taeniaeformis]